MPSNSLSPLVLTGLIVIGTVGSSHAITLRGILGDSKNYHNRYGSTTQADAYSSAEGQNPGGPGDAFTWFEAEASSASSYNGVYYNAGRKAVEAGDMAKGGWAGAYSKNNADMGTDYSISTNFDPEYATQRGTHSVSGTYLGARAVAGSGSMFGLSTDEKSAGTWTMDSYGPTAFKPNAVGDKSRSVAFTNIAPQSAAQSGIGSGPAAIATGWQVAAAARSHRDKKPPVTIGSRDSGDSLQAKMWGTSTAAVTQERGRRSLRRQLLMFA